MKFMLDTNICIFLMKNKTGVVEQYKSKKLFGVAISAITLAELYYGVCKSAFPEKNGANLTAFLMGFEVLEFDGAAAMEFGRIRAELQRMGTVISPMDTLIAAHAKAAGLVIVTNNVRKFARVEGLTIEDWANQ